MTMPIPDQDPIKPQRKLSYLRHYFALNSHILYLYDYMTSSLIELEAESEVYTHCSKYRSQTHEILPLVSLYRTIDSYLDLAGCLDSPCDHQWHLNPHPTA